MPLIASAAIGVGSEVYNIAHSAHEKNKAKKSLAELNQTPFPEISVAPELQGAYNRAQGNSKYGFSPEETAAFNQNLSRAQSTQFQAAKDIGGGQLAGTINNMNNANNINAINTFAAKGAGLQLEKQQYADSLAGKIQSIKNANQEQQIARRTNLEQAYGGAIKQQGENIREGISGIGTIGSQALASYGMRNSNTSTLSPSVSPDIYGYNNNSFTPNSSYNPNAIATDPYQQGNYQPVVPQNPF